MKTIKDRCAIFSIAGKGCIFFAAAFALFPPLVEAQCAHWDASGHWTLQQSNGYELQMDLTQKGNHLAGKAQSAGVSGPVHGIITGNGFHFVFSVPGQTRVYSAFIRSQGEIEGGRSFDHAKPSDTLTWWAEKAMKCAGAAPETTSASSTSTPPPLKPTTKPKSTMTAAIIRASPQTVTIPAGQTQGTTLLSWDGGKDHPYAEVWVKVDDQDEKKVVEAGKGRRQMRVEPGKTYVYMLEDAGQQLASVTVTGK